ncbi:hypothetical protein [Oceanibaculum nanhaiense]|uniref:hypothetical protein n=1 Tax=Oceanibaculum nanhaiense TaxID=1909734 RepID=UPI0011230D84|nr:hypothetical protein [Oceanibaculum nanhaiense]
MPRRTSPLGPETHALIEEARADLLHAALTVKDGENEPEIPLPSEVPDIDDEDAVDAFRDRLAEALAERDTDELEPLEMRARRIRHLAAGKGITSLETIVAQRLDDEHICVFEDQPDPLCRSIWTFVNARGIFEDAESFHFTRQFRDHRKLYDAFEVDLDEVLPIDAGNINTTALVNRLREELSIRREVSCTVSTVDLPATDAHPASVMLIVRHGGRLSSVFHLRDDGRRRAMYYRPPNEVTLIYTPSLRQIEICADSPVERRQVGDIFADVALGHDISGKPLTWKQYNLSRFRSSLHLERPDVEGYDITRVRVIEVEVRLGLWRRKLRLKVTMDDDIEDVADRCLGAHNVFRRADGFSRIGISVAYSRAGDPRERTMTITISGTKSCNLQSHKDPAERSLGFALLQAWGILNAFRQIDPADLRAMFAELVRLHDRVEDEVSGQHLRELGLDPRRLIEGGLLERRDRQDGVLIEEDGIEGEGTIEPSEHAGMVRAIGPFGEDAGDIPAGDLDLYAINREWLMETLVRLLKPLLTRRGSQQVLDQDLTLLGAMEIGGAEVPLYFARRLNDLKTLARLDVLMRARNQAGVGIVLSASQDRPAHLGPNVVVSILDQLAPDKDEFILSRDGLELAWRGGRELASGGAVPRVLTSGPQSATLHVPGKPPLALTGADQIRIFERLVAAALAGSPDVHVNTLMDGTGSRSPQQAFRTKTWKSILNVYIAKGEKRGYWRLVVDGASPEAAV